MSMDIAFKFASLVTSYRQDLHGMPELAWEETETIAYIYQQLISFKVSPIEKVYEKTGGVVCDIVVAPGQPFRLLRADVDALPLEADDGSTYNFHACGHDFHAAMMLALANLIAQGKVEPKVNLRLVWQRAEENPVERPSGGAVLVQEGVLQNVAEAYALHMDPRIPVGTFQSCVGAMLGNSGRFLVKVRSEAPQGVLCRLNLDLRELRDEVYGDAVRMSQTGPISSNIIPKKVSMRWDLVLQNMEDEIQGLVDEMFKRYPGVNIEVEYLEDILEITVESTGGHVGEAEKLINPYEVLTDLYLALGKEMIFLNETEEELESWWSARNFFDPDDVEALRRNIMMVIGDREEMQFPPAEIEVTYIHGHPTMRCAEDQVDMGAEIIHGLGFSYQVMGALYGAEDFAHYLNQVPGAMFMVGCWQEGCGSFHQPTYNPDPEALVHGLAFWIAMTQRPLLD